MTSAVRSDEGIVAKDQPTTTTDVPWLWAECPDGHILKTALGRTSDHPAWGKWLVFCSEAAVDRMWATVRDATERGELGSAAKAATAMGRDQGLRHSGFVICVYCPDANNLDDLRRVVRGLRDIGIRRPITFKEDAETTAGHYGSGTARWWSPGHTCNVLPVKRKVAR